MQTAPEAGEVEGRRHVSRPRLEILLRVVEGGGLKGRARRRHLPATRESRMAREGEGEGEVESEGERERESGRETWTWRGRARGEKEEGRSQGRYLNSPDHPWRSYREDGAVRACRPTCSSRSRKG